MSDQVNIAADEMASLLQALRSGGQLDEDGVMVSVSRQAAEVGADIIERLTALHTIDAALHKSQAERIAELEREFVAMKASYDAMAEGANEWMDRALKADRTSTETGNSHADKRAAALTNAANQIAMTVASIGIVSESYAKLEFAQAVNSIRQVAAALEQPQPPPKTERMGDCTECGARLNECDCFERRLAQPTEEDPLPHETKVSLFNRCARYAQRIRALEMQIAATQPEPPEDCDCPKEKIHDLCSRRICPRRWGATNTLATPSEDESK